MNRGRIALQIDRLRQPLKKALHTAGRLSYDGVQINGRSDLRPSELTETALREIRRLLDDLNLRVGSIVLPTRLGIASRERIDGRVAAIQQVMEVASRLQARTLLTNLGPLPDEGSEDRSMLLEVIGQLASVGDRVGVELALCAAEVASAPLAKLWADVPEETVGVNLDPAELIRGGQSTKRFVELHGSRIKHVYASDAVAGISQGESLETELGRGTADFAVLLGLLEQYGYRGWTTVSARPSAEAEDELANALQFLRSL